VSGLAWIMPFAVVTFSPLDRDTILARCAVLGGCAAALLLSGALEYVYSLSQYTARVQFADLDRSRLPEYTSVLFRSQFASYFYGSCALGWVLGILLLRGRPRILALTGAASGLSFFTYACAYMYSAGHWWLPIPIYIEHTLFPLFWTAAIAGYWGPTSHATGDLLHSSLVQEAALPRPELVPPLDQYCRRLLSNALPDISCSRCALSGRLSTHPSCPGYRRFTIREFSAPPARPSTGVVGYI
jgi:hypothetical protein